MGVLDLFSIKTTLEDIATSLRRIAKVAEHKAGFTAPGQDPSGRDDSTVYYTTDAETAQREMRRLAYEARTGKHLADWEEVPSAVDEDGVEW